MGARAGLRVRGGAWGIKSGLGCESKRSSQKIVFSRRGAGADPVRPTPALSLLWAPRWIGRSTTSVDRKGFSRGARFSGAHKREVILVGFLFFFFSEHLNVKSSKKEKRKKKKALALEHTLVCFLFVGKYDNFLLIFFNSRWNYQQLK